MGDVRSRVGERATIQAVASRAGVSPTTVSLVLAGKGGTRRISEGTHRLVQRAAEELNYAPNLGTRSLRGEKTNILSFFSSYRNRDRKDLYMNTLSSAVEAAGGAEGYDILVHCNFEQSPKKVYQFLNGGLADGLLFLAPREDDPLLALLRKSRLPVVIVNGRDPEGRYSSIEDDATQGMRLIVDRILAEGHQHLAALYANDPNTHDSDGRIELLRQYLGEHGVSIPDHRLIPANESNVDDVLAGLRREAHPPTVIFCWHDRLAYALLSACEAQGLSVPQDMSVVGYDGLHWPSRSSHIVSSVKIDLDDLATGAIRLLARSIQHPDLPPIHQTLPVSFLSGTSLGAAPSATEQII